MTKRVKKHSVKTIWLALARNLVGLPQPDAPPNHRANGSNSQIGEIELFHRAPIEMSNPHGFFMP